jgi:arylsulfatase A-like enzyme
VPRPPNILIICGDDIGISNLSCYSHGLIGYRTPNIDRIAAEGARFTDSCHEKSCTTRRERAVRRPRHRGHTIVLYSTDDGLDMNSWPDAGMTHVRNEKQACRARSGSCSCLEVE